MRERFLISVVLFLVWYLGGVTAALASQKQRATPEKRLEIEQLKAPVARASESANGEGQDSSAAQRYEKQIEAGCELAGKEKYVDALQLLKAAQKGMAGGELVSARTKLELYFCLGQTSSGLSEYHNAVAAFNTALVEAGRLVREVDFQTARIRGYLGNTFADQGKFDEAVQIISETLVHLNGDASGVLVASAYNRYALGRALVLKGTYAAAEVHLEKSLEITVAIRGKSHPEVGEVLHEMARLKHALGEYTESIQLVRTAVNIAVSNYGELHPSVARYYNTFAKSLRATNRCSTAKEYYEKALHILEQTLPPNHLSVGETEINLGVVLRNMKQYREALAHYEKGLAILSEKVGDNHPDTVTMNSNLAVLLNKVGDFDRARPFYERSIRNGKVVFGATHPKIALFMYNYASALMKNGFANDAIPMCKEAVRITDEVFGTTHIKSVEALKQLALALQRAGYISDSVKTYERILERLRAVSPMPTTEISDTLFLLGRLYFNQGDCMRAESYFTLLKPDARSMSFSQKKIAAIQKMLQMCSMKRGPNRI